MLFYIIATPFVYCPRISDTAAMLSAGMCLEVLAATIIAWIGLWGLVDEALQCVTDARIRCCAYASLLVMALVVVGVQKQVTVCGLL
jgi:hypothetical protein